jgi:outer membrane lipoprotein LolB
MAADVRCTVFAFAFSLLLAGCASLTPSTVAPPDSLELATRAYQETIELTGRLSVHYQKGGGAEALHGGFSWTQTPQRTVVAILSPLGQTIASIEITPRGATLTQAGQAPRAAADVDMLTADALGWPLPVAGLRDWLQGFGTDGKGRPFIASPRHAETSLTTYDGWRIRYSSWLEEGGQSRPKRIDLERSTAQAGDVAIRIVIDTWQPN